VIRALGIDVFLKDTGEGPPTLFLHGNPDSADLWDGVIERLQSSYRCLAPDLPGFGRSGDAGDLDCSLDGFARLVEAIVDGTGVTEPVNLVVHDLGGPIGLSWAIQNPEKVRRLAILNTLYSTAYRWHLWARIWRTPLLGELSLASMNWPLFKWSIRRGSRNLSEAQIRGIYRYVAPKVKRTILKLYRATDPESFRGWEERLLGITATVPTLVLWGDHDPYIPKRFAATFGTGNIRHFPDHGHWLPAEAPREVAEALKAHLA
jgi:pimeloyl-ACP methyl ester carboxylesterase